jgi:hypothetical protein
VYDVPKVQMPLPGSCVSAGAVVRNYGATNVASTQKHVNGLGININSKLRTTLLARTSSILDWTSQSEVEGRSRRLVSLELHC